MKRYAAVAAAVLSLTLVLAACGSDDDPAIEGGTSATTEENGASMDDHGASSDVTEGARRIEVTARSFEFGPDEIRVKAGEKITIVLTSTDILHDFTIDEVDAHVKADPNDTEEGGFTAGEQGRYEFYCSVAGHRDAGMEGTLIVE